MKAKLTVNGKEFDVDISDEQAKALTKSKKTGFERVNPGKDYAHIYYGISYGEIEHGGEFDDKRFKQALYFSNDRLSERYTKVIDLFLRLSQWQALNDKPAPGEYWAEIMFHNGELVASAGMEIKYFGVVRFSTQEKAEEAIEAFRSELEWYFKEFKPRLDA